MKDHLTEDMGIRHSVNFRGLGGYRADGGRRIRKGIFYRGGEMEGVAAEREDFQTLKGLGIRTLLDLRSQGEAEASPDPVLDGTDYIRICAMHFEDGTEIDFSPRGMMNTRVRMEEYIDSLGPSADRQKGLTVFYKSMPFHNPAFQELFRILEEERVPVLFHCSAGKDRTGVAAMLIMLAMGCSREDAVSDYLLTNVCRKEIIEESIRRRKETDPETDESMLREMYGVSRRNAEVTLDAVLEKCQSFDVYFEKEYGLDKKRIEALRDLYLE